MNQTDANVVLAIFRAWNALLGKNKWNLPAISDRTHQRWFNDNVLPHGNEARKVAAAVWRGVRAVGHEPLRENILAVVRELAPLAPVNSWDENSCGAWFFTMAESARNVTDAPPAKPHLDASALAEIRAEYLRWVIRECAPLRLQAIDQSLSKPGKEPIRLASVYVDLNLGYVVPKELSLAKYLNEQKRTATAPDKPDFVKKFEELSDPEIQLKGKRETRLVPVLEALAEHNKFVLLGAPGSGKSTVTAFVALQLALALSDEKDALKKLGEWWKHGQLLPVRVVLRQFAASLPRVLERGRAGDLWDFIHSEVNYDNRAGQTVECIRQISQNSGALFLLDGLDEVRDETSRRRMLEAVVEFMPLAGPRSRFLLTSRPYAWDDIVDYIRRYEEAVREGKADAFDKGLVELLKRLVSQLPANYRLAHLDENQIETFITHWYDAVESAHWITKADADRKRDELIEAVKRPDLVELAKNPLLLTLMATLHTNRARLPDDRADLYNEVVELLLLRWNEASGADKGLLDALQIPTLKLSDLREIMEQLAYDAHAAHVGKAGVADIPENVLVTGLRPLLANSADKAETALNYIENRAGLLLGQGKRGCNRQYTFPHRTFQEYLAACHLANRPDFYEKAAELARENHAHWQEVLPLAARYAKAGRGVPAADVLVRRQEVKDAVPASLTEADWRAAVLAGKQLLEIGLAAVESRIEHKVVRDRVAHWLAAIIERSALSVTERAQTGFVLGKLGDPRKGVRLTNGLPDIDWIEIPPGKFLMGGEGEWHGGGQFKCDLIKQPYKISRYPITVAQYQAFVDGKGYEEKRFWTKAGWEWRTSQKVTGPQDYDPAFQTPNHPRVGVSWFEAGAFCKWLTERLSHPSESSSRGNKAPTSGKDGASLPRLLPGEKICLPSEAEWERAARGEKGRPYPWGEEENFAERCNCGKTGINHTSAVGLFPSGDTKPLEPGNKMGVADMTGNVWEWCHNLWLKEYKQSEKNVSDDLEGEGSRVLRGASWFLDGPDLLRSSARSHGHPGNRNGDVGCRVVCVGASAR